MDPATRHHTDAALAGDPAAFEALIRLHGRSLYAIAYALLQNATEAEDVVQETFIRAWQTNRRPTDPEKFLPWLATLARNRSRDVLRRRRGVPLPPEDDLPATPEPAAGAALDAAVDRAQLQHALAGLPRHYREALTLRYLDDLDCRSVEQVMGLSNGALRGILGRALESLRRALSPSTALRHE